MTLQNLESHNLNKLINLGALKQGANTLSKDKNTKTVSLETDN